MQLNAIYKNHYIILFDFFSVVRSMIDRPWYSDTNPFYEDLELIFAETIIEKLYRSNTDIRFELKECLYASYRETMIMDTEKLNELRIQLERTGFYQSVERCVDVVKKLMLKHQTNIVSSITLDTTGIITIVIEK